MGIILMDGSIQFCKICGSSVLRKRKDAPAGHALSINVLPLLYLCLPRINPFQSRMLRGISVSYLEEQPFPGGDLDPPYTPPKFPAHPSPEPGTQTYNGNCHCGAVTISVKFKQLSEVEVMSCNCSLCSRVSLSFPTGQMKPDGK